MPAAKPINELTDLRADYRVLGLALKRASGSELAALARERRMMRARLTELESSSVRGTVADEVARRRESKATAARPPARRRKSR